MARDENNGELPFSQRFFYASGRKAFKQAHASARRDGSSMFYFGQQMLYTHRGCGDVLNTYAHEGVSELRYGLMSPRDIQQAIAFKRGIVYFGQHRQLVNLP